MTFATTLAVVGLFAAGCSESGGDAIDQTTAPSDTAPSDTATSPPGDSDPSSSSEPNPPPSGDPVDEPPLPGIAPTHLSLELIPGIEVIQRTDQDLRMYSRSFAVPGADPLNEEMSSYADEAWDAYEGIAADADDSDILTPGLNVQTVVIASAPDLIGIQMLTFQEEPSTYVERARTAWWNGEELIEPPGLFIDDDAWQQYADLVVEETEAAGYGVAEGNRRAEHTAVGHVQ